MGMRMEGEYFCCGGFCGERKIQKGEEEEVGKKGRYRAGAEGWGKSGEKGTSDEKNLWLPISRKKS